MVGSGGVGGGGGVADFRQYCETMLMKCKFCMCSVSLRFLCILSLYNVPLQYIYNCITFETSTHGYYHIHVLHFAPSQYLALISMTTSTPNNLINISISSHQINEINYQCLKNTFVFSTEEICYVE